MNRSRLVAFPFFRQRRVMSDIGDQRGKTHVPTGERFDPGTAQDREDIASVWNGRIVVGEFQNKRVIRPVENTSQSTKQSSRILRRQFVHQTTPRFFSR